MDTVASTLRQIRADQESGALSGLCEELDIDLLVLFGSARRHIGAAQDVDLAYSFRAGAKADDLTVVNALGERYGDFLDLMPLDRADIVAQFEALSQGEILVELTPEKFATRQIRAFGLYRDTQWMRDLQLKALAS